MEEILKIQSFQVKFQNDMFPFYISIDIATKSAEHFYIKQ